MIKRIFNWLCDHTKHPLSLLIVGSLGISCAQHIVFTSIDRSERRLNRKYELLQRASSLPVELYQDTWNLWYSEKNRSRKGEAKHASNVQSLYVEANAMDAELTVLFGSETSQDWGKFLKIYANAQYPITRDGISEEKLNKELKKAVYYIERVVSDIAKAVK